MPPEASTRPRPILFYHAMALATICIWSFSFLFIIWINKDLSPLGVAVGRKVIFAALVIALVVWRRPCVRTLNGQQWLIVLGLALVGGPLYHIIFAWSAGQAANGESRIQTALLGLILATVPIHANWLGAVFLRERLTWKKVLALAIGLSGVAVVIGAQQGRIDLLPREHLEGPIAATFAAMIGGGIAVLTRAARKVYEPFDLVAVSGVFIVLFMLPFIPWAQLERAGEMSAVGWIGLSFLGIFGSGIAFLTWATAMRGLQAGTAATYLFLAAVLSALWGWIFRGEAVSWVFIPGAFMVLAGLLIMAREGRRIQLDARRHETGFSNSMELKLESTVQPTAQPSAPPGADRA